MAYETKVILKTLHELLLRAETVEEAARLVKDIANAEGVVIDDKGTSKDEEDKK